MKSVYIYQVLDVVSEGLISTFVGPNDRYAMREFGKMLTDPKIKDSIDPSDFTLVRSDAVSIADSYSDIDDLTDIAVGCDVVSCDCECITCHKES